MNLSGPGAQGELLTLGTWQEGVGHTMGPQHQQHSLGSNSRTEACLLGRGAT